MISIITPVHSKITPYLQAAYNSLQEQTFSDWEWVIVLNNGGVVPFNIEDNRIKIVETFNDNSEHNKIGRLKNFACSKAQGNIIVEFDGDDLLTEDALFKIQESFSDPEIAMVYSNHAEFNDGTWEPKVYGSYWGWESRDFIYKEHALKEMIAWPPNAQMMRSIHWAPNHVRAWRTKDYHAIGGHNVDLKTGDDHELNCRIYIAYGGNRIKHIDECLYIYRVHQQNSCITNNAEVQQQSLNNYLKYNRDMAVRWAKDEDLSLIDLGGRLNSWDDFTTVDLFDADVVTDLNDSWPLSDNSVGVIRASHIFEHLKDSVHTMNEAYRVLAPGGWLFLEVPSTDGRGAFQDPGHVSFWNENSIWYYTNRDFARFIPDFEGRFQSSRVVTYFPTDFEEKHNIPIVQADLIALKEPYDKRPVGEVLI